MRFIIYCTVLLVFLPKINFIELPGSSGLRIDDVFIFFLFMLFSAITLLKKSFLNFLFQFSAFRVVLYILLLSFFSIFLNIDSISFINFLYAIRLLEYSLFMFIGYYMFKFKFNFEKMVVLYGMLSMIVILLQYFGIIGGFALGTYTPDVSSRPIGLTAGPWEVALLLNYSLVVFAFWNKKNRKNILAFSILSLIAVSFTGSRIGLLSMIVIVLILYKQYIIKILSLIIPVTFIFFYILSDSLPVVQRSQTLFNVNNLIVVMSIYDNVDITNSLDKSINVNMATTDYDVSWLIRVTKWIYIIKNNFNDFLHILIGYSPGYYGPAIDGSYIRIFGELGLLGIVLYFRLLKTMMINQVMILLMIATLINMIFIDVIYAYKIMSILFMAYGYYFCKIKNERLKNGKTVNNNSNL